VWAICRITHEKTQQSSNGIIAHLEAKAEEDSAEDEILVGEEVIEDVDDEEGDESDDVCLSSLLQYHHSEISALGCRNYHGTNRSISGLPVSNIPTHFTTQ
jgi:hypothetical protein